MMDEGGSFGSLMGLPWSRLLPSEIEEGVKAPPMGRAPLRLPCDVMRLPIRDMHDLGHWPETDAFCTVECELCGRLMVPHALRGHMEEHHVDALATLKTKLTKPRIIKKVLSTSPPQQQQQPPVSEDFRNETEPVTVYCSLCSAAVPSAGFRRHAIKTHGDINSAKPLKNKTAAKPSPPKKTTSKSASASPVELTEESVAKDSKKLVKKKKAKVVVNAVAVPAAAAVVEPEAVVAKKTTKKKKDKVWVSGEYDPCNHCGVVNDEGNPCLRNIVCRLHPVALRRLVNRPFPYDVLAKITKTPNDTKTEQPPPPVVVVVEQQPTPPEPVKVDQPPVKRIKTEPIAEEEEQFQEVPVVPRPKPLLCWSLESPVSPPIPPQPPTLLPDLPWHASQPRPLATNTFGCRIVGGLLTPSKKWDSLRKHIQTVWAQGSQEPVVASKPVSKTIAAKKAQAAAVRRKRKSSGSSSTGVDNLLNGLLQPANGVNSVPLRLFNGNQPTFIQLNLCPSK